MNGIRQTAIVIVLAFFVADASSNVGEADAATVAIGVYKDDELAGHGSGFFISSRGHLITNAHVVPEQNFTYMVRFNGTSLAEALVLDVDRSKDLALLKIETGEKISIIPLAKTRPEKGDTIFTLGFPTSHLVLQVALQERGMAGGETATVTNGVVSNYYEYPVMKSGPPTSVVQHTAEIRKGNSGGPLVNRCGEVVGINTFGLDFSEFSNVGEGQDYFSVASSELIRFLGSKKLAFVKEAGCGDGSAVTSEVEDIAKRQIGVSSNTSSQNEVGVSLFNWPTWLGGMAVIIALTVLFLDRKPGRGSARRSSGSRGVKPNNINFSTLSGAGFDSQGHAFSFAVTDSEASGEGCIIGRSRDVADILLEDETISRAHLIVRQENHEFEAMDLNSTNQSTLNGRLLDPFKAVVLKTGDELSLGTINVSISID